MPAPGPDPLAALEAFLLDVELPDEVMLLGQAEGLIAASLVVPGLLHAEELWVPAAWGGGPAPFGETWVDELRALLLARRTAVIGALLLGDMAYDPAYEIDLDDAPLWQFWIEGFSAGVALAEEAWIAQFENGDEDLGAALLGLRMLIELADDPKRSPELDEQAPYLIPYLVETLYRRQRNLPRIVLDPQAVRPPFAMS